MMPVVLSDHVLWIYSFMAVATIQPTRTVDMLASDPLTATHRRELTAARDRSKVIRKAARVAAFNGWSTAAIAALSATFCVYQQRRIATDAWSSDRRVQRIPRPQATA